MKLISSPHEIGDRKKHASRLLNQPKYDVVQIHMKKDEEITTHHAKVETLIIVRAGKVSFTVEGETVILTNENILQMDPYEEHSLTALEESDLLLLKMN